jgi:hypothetical protein
VVDEEVHDRFRDEVLDLLADEGEVGVDQRADQRCFEGVAG